MPAPGLRINLGILPFEPCYVSQTGPVPPEGMEHVGPAHRAWSRMHHDACQSGGPRLGYERCAEIEPPFGMLPARAVDYPPPHITADAVARCAYARSGDRQLRFVGECPDEGFDRPRSKPPPARVHRPQESPRGDEEGCAVGQLQSWPALPPAEDHPVRLLPALRIPDDPGAVNLPEEDHPAGSRITEGTGPPDMERTACREGCVQPPSGPGHGKRRSRVHHISLGPPRR